MPARCPTCDALYTDDNQFCVLDGTQLVAAPAAAPADAAAYASATPAPAASAPAPVAPAAAAPARSDTRTGLLVGLLAGLVVVLGGAVAVLTLRSDAPVPPASGAAPVGAYSGGQAGDVAPQEVAPAEAEPVASPPPSRDLVAVGTAAPPRTAASYGPARVETDGMGLLMRDGPGRGYAVVGKMMPGDVVTVEGCEGGTPGRRWCRVVYGGVQGWALDEFLVIGGVPRDTDSGLEDAFAASEPFGAPAYIDGSEVSFVNLRAEPFTGGTVVMRLRPNASLTLVRCLPYGWSLGGRAITGRWCFVNAAQGGRTASGWASDGALRW